MGHLHPSAECFHISWARVAATDSPAENEADVAFGARSQFAHAEAFVGSSLGGGGGKPSPGVSTLGGQQSGGHGGGREIFTRREMI